MSALAEFRPGVDGPFGFRRAQRLFRRAGFGGTVDEVRSLVELGLDGAIEAIGRDPAPESITAGGAHRPSAGIEEARAWWIERMLSGTGALRERLTLFWHGHFATSNNVVLDLGLMLQQNEVLRWNGDGEFGHLLKRVVLGPAMTRYLDGNLNVRSHPNENLAREVLELFALGHGNYTQVDVRELARALTGWSVVDHVARFDPNHHDDGIKTILGRRGRFDAAAALDVVAGSPACARYISALLWRQFVGEPVAPGLRDELAEEFQRVDLHVGRFVDRILRSRGFLSPAEATPREPGPVELGCVMGRGLGVMVDARQLADHATRMGQALFTPPSVAGWPEGSGWSSTSWCLRRMELPFLLLNGMPTILPAGTSPYAYARQAFGSHAASQQAIDQAEHRLRGFEPGRALACLLALPELQWI